MPSVRPITALRGFYAGWRLVLCTAAGAFIFALASHSLTLPLRLALAWVLSVVLFLWLTALAIGDGSPARARQRARLLDQRPWVVLTLIVTATGVSLLAMGFLLHKEPGASLAEHVLRIVLASLSMLASWTLTHTMFALYYAHHYYGTGDADHADRGGLQFPGEPTPDYWDFFYFSFVIGMTCQVSDVQVGSRPMRRLVLIHGVLSFFFNAVILALAVNFLASGL